MEEGEKSVTDGPEDEKFKTPKSVLFFVLSILWIFPSLTAMWMIVRDFSEVRPVDGLGEFFSAIKLEQWVGVFLLLLHAVFIFIAVRYRNERRKI